MTKSILISLAIVTLSTSAALAVQRTHHHRHAAQPNASTAAMNPNAGPMMPNAFGRAAPSPAFSGVSSEDRGMFFRNLHDSGYDKKNDFNPNGTVRNQ
jgi:hypothetical protein